MMVYIPDPTMQTRINPEFRVFEYGKNIADDFAGHHLVFIGLYLGSAVMLPRI
jgi:hypothetical protein